jgi:hypothetical protein
MLIWVRFRVRWQRPCSLACPLVAALHAFLSPPSLPPPSSTHSPLLQIEFPLPDIKTKRHIFKIHTSKMATSEDVDLEEFVMAKDELSGADIKVTNTCICCCVMLSCDSGGGGARATFTVR